MTRRRFISTLCASFVLLRAAAQDGPWNHRILLATSSDGLSWSIRSEPLAEKASVPELFLDPNGRPTIFFVDASGTPEGIGALQLTPEGAWQRVGTDLRDVDPNIVLLPDGTYRAYTKSSLDGAISAYSSKDGLHWDALGEVFRDPRYTNATDPDVFQTPGEWVMLVSLGANLLRCTSTDGLHFTATGTILSLGGSVSDTVPVEGGWRTYFHVNPNPATSSLFKIRSAFTPDGKAWQVEDGDRVIAPPDGPASLGVADPAPIQLPDGSWLMAIKSFIAPISTTPPQPAQPGGILNHHVASATSPDGLTWTRDEGLRLTGASVPCAINDNGSRVILYFVQPPTEATKPETVACAVSTDGMNFQRESAFQIEGLSTLKAVDPSIIKDSQGRFRLYYLASDYSGDPAAGPNPHSIRMALSDDGIRFRESASVFDYDDLVDPDVFRVKDQWLMYVYSRNATIVARSDDGLRFTYEGPMSPTGWGTTAPITLPDGTLRLYAFDQRTPTGNAVRSFVSTDGIQWAIDPGIRLQAGPAEQITDPFVIPWRGGYKMYFKTSTATRQFTTGQAADLILGAKGFNNSGGALLFNHPTGLATDGTSLLLADRWNNRVLIWKSAPTANTPPDLVLGQPGFDTNNSGAGLHQLNWPGNVAITPDGQTVAVADTNNHRVLLWNHFPERSSAVADVVIDLTQLPQPAPAPGVTRCGWPWGVWTDGHKFAIVATQGSAALIWNSLPTANNQPPDLVLRPAGAGTPRNITSDGRTFFALSDHNYGEASRPATMVWLGFPSEPDQPPAFSWPEWMKGTVTADGGLILAGLQSISLWSQLPQNFETAPALILKPQSYRNGDGPDAVVAQGRLYVSNYNGNNVLAWNSIPTAANQLPDFALGSDTPAKDTWADNFFIQNPALATDGKSLFASSDFDRKLFVWRSLPNNSGAQPDAIIHLQEGPWDNALFGTRLAAAGRSTVYLWNTLPLNGEKPDVTLTGRIGSVDLRELTGVAMDARYFYLADRQANRIHVWDGLPTPNSEPRFSLEMPNPGRLSSDGNYLFAAPFEGQQIYAWKLEDLAAGFPPIRIGSAGQFNLPGDALAANSQFFVADRSNNRVHVWYRFQDALDGKPANAFLGALNAGDRSSGLTPNKLFMPGSLAFDGKHLWVGEFKFSTRILRFTP
ncbi:MAG: hypothetical protein HY821_24580 [Acidobacteria bacterium]|nr:hypothetical protein [Acidobacteriota bacterium]